MRDLFDDFMDELRKRQAGQAEGAEPGDSESRPPDDEPGRSGDDTRAVRDGAEAAAAGAVHDRAAAGDARAEDDRAGGGDAPPEAGDDGATDEPEPEPIEAAGRRRTGGGPPRRPRRRGGPNDGGGPRAALGRLGRRFFLGLVIVGLLLLVALLGVGLDLWTDAIWFTSVGYESVFWTRVGTQAVLFVLVFAAALAVLLGNLWIAGRLAPPPDPTRPGSLQGLFERMAESATRQAEGRRRPGRGPFDRYTSDDESTFSPFGGVGGGLGGRGRPPFGARPIVVGGEELPDLTPIARWILAIVALFIALGAAGSMAGSWETILLWVNRVPFAPAGQAPVNDPVFGRDVSFFLFELPFFRLIQGLINGLLLSGLLLALARYVVGALRGSLEFTTPIRLHLALLAGLYLVSVAAGYQLDKYELVYSARGVATGVSYTDANAQFLAFDALTVIAALAGAFLVGGAFTRMVWPLGLAVGIWFLASVVLGQLYPAAVQQFAVIPDQRAKEQPYIVNNVKMTRLAYDIQDWATTEYRGEATLTQAAVDQESATFENARVWDYRPLGSTLDQLQRVRNYYDFFDVDTDRYQLDGALRQVMLSAREIAPDNVPQASSWVNQRINYTHGVGLAYLPVNGATPGGQPDLLIKDLPPQSSDGAPVVSQFRIYFGERPSDYIIVGTQQSEFDYPVGGDPASETPQTTRWTGASGIRIENTLTRLLFAARFRDLNMLISDQVTAGSQLLFHRSIDDRLSLIAPFLAYDKDPYLVVTAEGRLVWIQDAYTTSDRFPNAQYVDPASLPNDSRLAERQLNYVRNSVKVVVDAYDGTTKFYVADPTDPIVRAYEGVFPSMFTPLSAMPADLRAHLRVPEELFNVQTRIYERYHVTSPDIFYSSQDLWTVPTGASSDQTLPTEAYYVVMPLPGQREPEFLLLQPMVPRGRPNMIAWVAARNDGDNYGQVKVFRFPENTSVLGPDQIDSKISADPTISSQISLWHQAGSKVIRGNLIVMPVQDSIIYLQPVYLSSTSAAELPLLQKVILATSSRIVWGDSLAQALKLLLAGGGTPTPTPTPTPGPSASPGATPTPAPSATRLPGESPPSGDVAALVDYANRHFETAQQALRDGDFARYGSEIALVQQALRDLQSMVGGSLAPASPAP